MSHIRLLDRAVGLETFEEEILEGLRRRQKKLAPKYLYDERGSQLFEEITRLEEYYLTRTELAIMRRWSKEMAGRLGPGCLVIEYGSDTSAKTRLLLDHLADPAGYVPLDISRRTLLASARRLADEYPGLEILPVCGDYMAPLELPEPTRRPVRRVVYFPGSTLGNFEPDQARAFLSHTARLAGRGGRLLIGLDINRDPARLHPAYNDAGGVTAEFNLNLLVRINRELDGEFPVERFRHYAYYNPQASRIEMHLVSLDHRTVPVGRARIPFWRGESIWTESSYKFALSEFEELAATSGWEVEAVWTDSQELFSVQLLSVR